jgi:hypothetical protein
MVKSESVLIFNRYFEMQKSTRKAKINAKMRAVETQGSAFTVFAFTMVAAYAEEKER